ncbi:hypothetical protein BS78_02G096100 [Paspalum vaginatum]|nr:hypothetical protein BS78_02G096100 [Paspalum vaginatum]
MTPFSLPIRATLLVPPPLLPLLPSMPPPPTNYIRSGQAKGRVFRDSSLFLPHITCVRMKRSGSYAGRIERCCWSSAAPPHPSPIERMRWNRAHQHAIGRTQDSGRCWSFARPHPHPHSADSVHLLTSSRALLGPEAIREVFGLKINFRKSQLYCFGETHEPLGQYMEIIGCGEGNFPFNYLGSLILSNTFVARKVATSQLMYMMSFFDLLIGFRKKTQLLSI